MMYRDLEHPEITMALNTGYPSWMQEDDLEESEEDEDYELDSYGDEDRAYEESRESELFGDY